MYKSKRFRSAGQILSQQAAKSQQSQPKNDENSTSQAVPDQDSDSAGLPPSQELAVITQQRYLSQRSNRHLLTKTSSALKSSKRVPLNYYESVLLKCDVDLDHDDFYVLNSDHITFLNRVKTLLRNNMDNVPSFTEGVRLALKDRTTFKKLLCGCLIRMPDSDRVPQSQESAMKLFLMVDFLQPDMVSALMDSLKSCVQDEELTSPPDSVALILGQLRMVRIFDNETVYNRLFEILALADENARQAIISSLDDVLDISLHDQAIVKLMELIPNDAEFLTEATVDTLGNMCLSNETTQALRTKMLKFLKEGATLSFYPALVKFLLRFDDSEVAGIPEMITELRECLLWPQDGDAKLRRTVQQSVFFLIGCSLKVKKAMFSGWLRAIQAIDDKHDHRPIDLIVLVVMIKTNDEKAGVVENVLKRRIKKELFTSKLLEQTIQDLRDILLEYMPSFMECIDNFFHDRDPVVARFAQAAYRQIFGLEQCDRKLLLTKLIGFVCEKHVDLPFVDSDVRTNALNLLLEINAAHPSALHTNALQMLRILERTADLTVAQFRIVVELLCLVAYSKTTPSDMLQEHLTMFVQKLLSSTAPASKRQGIVGAIRIVDHTIWSETGDDAVLNCSGVSDKTIETIAEVPEGLTRNAAKLTQLMVTSASAQVDTLVFAYDELAAEFSPHNKRQATQKVASAFLNYWENVVNSDFLRCFIAETREFSKESNCGKLVSKFCINHLSELSNASSVDLSVNIADLVIHPTDAAFESITMLTPTLNLMRSFHLTMHKGSLESINAVLGCAVVVPDLLGTEDALDIFDAYTSEQAAKLLDCHYHVVNWYRELISAFVFVRSTAVGQIRQKVMHRLTELIKIEETIRTLLKLAPASYAPPICQFSLGPTSKDARTVFKRPADPKPTTSTKRGRKVNKEAPHSDADNLTVLNGTATNLDATARIVAKSYAALHGPKEVYRQLDTDIMYLLEESLLLVTPLPDDKIGEALGLQEMRFLLNDLVEKFETATGVKKHAHQPVVGTPALMIEDLVRLLPKLMGFLDQFTGHIKELLETTAGNLNHQDFFSDTVIYTKICFGLCLRLLCALFSWPDFEVEANEGLLKESLSHMVKESIFSPVDDQTAKSAALSAVKSLKNNAHLALDITSALEMYRLSRAIGKHAGDEDADKLSSALCESFLSRAWYSLTGADERGAQFNVALEELVQGLVKGASLEQIRKHTGWLRAEIGQLDARNGILSTFPCFGKANVPILYRGLSQGLIAAILESVATVLHSMRQLTMWEQAVEILNDLLDIVERVKIPRNFHLFLKYSQLFFKIFLRNGFEMLESCIKKTTERIVQLLKKLQCSTRFLHRLVCQSKVIQDKAVIRQIPLIRQVVEANIYRVKAALVANKLSSAFYMGSLKNRDAQGVVILSQVLPEQVSRSESDETGATVNGEDVIPEQTHDDELLEAMMAIHEGDSAEHDASESRRAEEEGEDESNSHADETTGYESGPKPIKRRRRQR